MSELDSLINAINKVYGDGSIAKLGEAKAIVGVMESRMPTGSLALDVVLGGGLPLGRVIEFTGPYSCGKSFITRKAISACQKAGGTAALIDVERDVNSQVDVDYLQALGVDTEKLLIVKKPAEEAMDIVKLLVQSRKVQLIVYDSISMTLPQRVAEKDMNEDTMGIEAKRNNLFMRTLTSAMQPKNLYDPNEAPWCSIIIINQLRQGMGKYDIPAPGGGEGLKYVKSISVEFRRSDWLGETREEVIKQDVPRYGQRVSFITRKNKTFTPFVCGSLELYFKDLPDGTLKKGDYDDNSEILDLGISFGIIERAGPSYIIDDKKWFGKKTFCEFLIANPQYKDSLKKKVLEKATNKEELKKITDETAVEIDGGEDEDEPPAKKIKKDKSKTRE